jgi:hypothetical protein
MNKPIVVVGFPTISQLIRGYTVVLEYVVLMPDDQLFNESKKSFTQIDGYGSTKITLVQTDEGE